MWNFRGGAMELSRMSWKKARLELKKGPVALLPVGSTEQHGPHLPWGQTTSPRPRWRGGRRPAGVARSSHGSGRGERAPPPVLGDAVGRSGGLAGLRPGDRPVAGLPRGAEACVRERAWGEHRGPRRGGAGAAAGGDLRVCVLLVAGGPRSHRPGHRDGGSHGSEMETSAVLAFAPELVDGGPTGRPGPGQPPSGGRSSTGSRSGSTP